MRLLRALPCEREFCRGLDRHSCADDQDHTAAALVSNRVEKICRQAVLPFSVYQVVPQTVDGLGRVRLRDEFRKRRRR